MDVPSWSMWAGKDQLLFSYNGGDILEGANLMRQAFELLRQGGSGAQLILKVYKSLNGQEITNKTPWNNSFGFALFTVDEDSPVQLARTQGYTNLEKRIDQLQEMITTLATAEPEQEEKPGGVMGVIGSLLEKNPQLQDVIVTGVVGMVKNFFNKSTATSVAVMGNIEKQPETQTQGSAWETLPIDQQEKMKKAMEILMRLDPQIGDHLLGLANIAQNKPSQYKMALTFL
jgi:hypothetical protein